MTPRSSPSQRPIGLDEWIAMRGPLWPTAALVIALDSCARASRLGGAEFRHVIGSLNTAGITRHGCDGWSWVPVPGQSVARNVPDTEVIERLGAILFHCLTGQALEYPFPVEQTLRTRLRSLRSELPAPVMDLTVEALSGRRRSGVTLASFARDVRQALAIDRQSGRQRSHRRLRLLGSAAGTLLAVTLVAWWLTIAGGLEGKEAHGLTSRETALLDIATDAIQTFALMDEHTAAIQQSQQLARLWRARVAPEDPRVAWNEAHEAWIRTLAGDRLTTEQLLEDKPSWLARELGDDHPYTRAVRLALAATLDARGATTEAAALRMQAERATRDLLGRTGRASDVLDSVPAPAGVLAHVAPNMAEREGFRLGAEGRFFFPLTSIQRWVAAREGWRLHLVASGACRVSLPAGTDSRLITLNTSHSADKRWRLQIEGASPATTLEATAADRMAISVVAYRTGVLEVRSGEQSTQFGVDATSGAAVPPYALTFGGGSNGTGCAVVWLEIPFPFDATSKAAAP